MTSKLLDNQQQNQQLKCIFSCWLNCCPTPNGEVLALDGEVMAVDGELLAVDGEVLADKMIAACN